MSEREASETQKRKDEHLSICLDRAVAARNNPFDLVKLQHRALPEMSLDDVSPASSFLGKQLAIPLLISSMTGGTDRAGVINRNLAEAAESTGVALSLGSGRAGLLADSSMASYKVRSVAATALLIANIGAVQLNYGVTCDDLCRLVDAMGADAIYLHLNPLQEALQPRGNCDFRLLLGKIEDVCRRVGVPVLAKEVGSGIDLDSAQKLIDVGIAAIDVAGSGGTSWAMVESYRADGEQAERTAQLFHDWGTPTPELILELRAALHSATLIASGGIRNGLDVAKAIALGADVCGIARPLLEAASQSAEEVIDEIGAIRSALSVAMFATGALTLSDLRGRLRLAP